MRDVVAKSVVDATYGTNSTTLRFVVADLSHSTLCNESTTKKAHLSLGKARYSQYSSCCSTDFEDHPRSMIFIYVI